MRMKIFIMEIKINQIQKQNNKTFIKKKRNRQEKQKELPKQLLNYPTKEEEYESLKENKEYFDNIKDEKLDSLLKDKNYIFGNYSNFYYNRYLENFKENDRNLIKEEELYIEEMQMRVFNKIYI